MKIKKKVKPVRVTVLLDPQTAALVDEHAARVMRSRSNAIEVLVRDALTAAAAAERATA